VISIDEMTASDWQAVKEIYRQGIATGDATLEIDTPEWGPWDRAHRAECRLVARTNGGVVGWVALTPYSARQVYQGVAWESVYVAEAARGRGVGRRLLESLIEASEGAGIWTLLAGVLVENAASLAAHERAGFRRVGVQERIGKDGLGRWRDVVLMERRSNSVGRS